MEAQPPEIEQHKMEAEGLRKRRPGVSITDRYQRSLHQESLRVLVNKRWEWYSLLLPHTPLRTLQPAHEARGAALHMLGEVLLCLVQFL